MEVLEMYYYNNGDEKKGPFTLDALKNEKIRPETLIKSDSMADWKPASQVPEVRALFTNKPFDTKTENQVKEPMPKTWLVEAILTTLFCCLPFGIVALVYSSKVESRYFSGQIDEAQKASQSARMWVLTSLIVGIGVVFMYLLWMLVLGGTYMSSMMNV